MSAILRAVSTQYAFLEANESPCAAMSADRECRQYYRRGYHSKLSLKERKAQVQPRPYIRNVSYIVGGIATVTFY